MKRWVFIPCKNRSTTGLSRFGILVKPPGSTCIKHDFLNLPNIGRTASVTNQI